MNGFSKKNLVGSTKQRSIELLHLLSTPQNPEPIDINTSSSRPKAPQSHKIRQPILEHSHSPSPSSQLQLEDDDSDSYSDGEQQSSVRFLLHRSRSVSSEAAPHRSWFYEAGGRAKIQAAAAVKRAFSMRISSPSYSSSSSSVVSDQKHCRTINGRCLTMYSPYGDDNTGDAAQSMVNNNNIELQTTSLQKKKKKKKKMGKLQQRTGKIVKACKGIFGL